MSANRVLIVEDHPDGAAALAALFDTVGCPTRVHPTGVGVPQAVAEFRPDKVVLDLDLPGKSGLEVAKELARLPDRPRVALYTARKDLLEAADLPAGLVDVALTKAGDPNELIGWATDDEDRLLLPADFRVR